MPTQSELDSDPKFAALDYLSQQQVRMHYLSQDPNFTSLDPQSQNQVAQHYATLPPVFQNTDVAQKAMNLVQGFQNGNGNTVSDAMMQKGYTGPKPLQVGPGMQMAGSQSTPGAEMQKWISTQDIGSQSVVMQTIGKAASNLISSITGNQNLSWDAQHNPDTAKAAQWFKSVLTNSGYKDQVGVNDFMSQQAALATDLIPFQLTASAAGGAIAAKVGGEGAGLLTTLGAKLATKAPGKLLPWLAGSMMPALGQATLGGIFGIARENVIPNILGSKEAIDNSFAGYAKNFATYAGLNSALGLTLNIAGPFLSLSGRVLGSQFKKAGTAIDSRFAMMDLPQAKAAMEAATTGTPFPQFMKSLPQATQDFFQGVRNQVEAGAMRGAGALSDPFYQMASTGSLMQQHVLQLPEGGYRIRTAYTGANRNVAQNFDDINAVKDKLAQIAVNHADKLGATDGAAWLNEVIKAEPWMDDAVRSASDAKNGFGIKRPIINATEASGLQDAMKTTGAEGVLGVVDNVPANRLARVKEGFSPLADEGHIIVRPPKEGEAANVLVPVSGRATADDVAQATAKANQMVSEGSKVPGEQLVQKMLTEGGVDNVDLGGGSFAYFKPNLAKWIDEGVDVKTGLVKGEGNAVRYHVAPTDAGVKTAIAVKVSQTFNGPELGKNSGVVADLLANMKGNVSEQSAKNVAALILRSHGVNPSEVAIQVVPGLEKTVVKTMEGGRKLVQIPSEITTPTAQRAMANTLLGALKDTVEGKGSGAKVDMEAVSHRFAGNRQVYLSPFANENGMVNMSAQKAWLEGIVNDKLNGAITKDADGVFSVDIPGRKPAQFNTLEAVSDYVLGDPSFNVPVKDTFAAAGWKLEENKGIYTVSKGAQKIEGADLNAILEKTGLHPQLDSSFAPKVTAISPDAVSVDFQQGIMSGSLTGARDALGAFRDYSSLSKYRYIVSNMDGTITSGPAGEFRVEMPDIGTVRNFTNPGDAKAFLNGEWKNWENLTKMAQDRGFVVTTGPEGYRFTSEGVSKSAKDMNEFKKLLKSSPDPDGAPSMLPDSAQSSIKDFVDSGEFTKQWKAATVPSAPNVYKNFEGKDKLSAHQVLGSLIRPQVNWLKDTSTHFGYSDINKAVQNSEAAARFFGGHQLEMEKLIDRYHDIAVSKGIKPNEWKTFTRAIQSGNETAKASIIAEHGLSKEKFDILDDMTRSFFGRNTNEGMFKVSGMDGYRFVTDYMPRIAEAGAKGHLDDAMFGNEVMGKVGAGDFVPTGVSNPFEHMRSADILSFATKDDLFDIMKEYSFKTLKKVYMDAPLKEINAAWAAHPEMPNQLSHNLAIYAEQLTGFYSTNGERAVNEMTGAFFNGVKKMFGKEVPLGSEEAGRKIIQGLYKANFITSLAFRPYAALRNLFQINNTSAFIGLETTMKAMKEIADMAPDAPYLQKLWKTGILSYNFTPVTNEMNFGQKISGKVSEFGMRQFRTGDTIPRAIAYRAAEMDFEKALLRFDPRQPALLPKFVEESGLSKLAAGDRAQAIDFLRAGNFDAAKDFFGQQAVHYTQVEYMARNRPAMYRGFIGKAFGTFGMYGTGVRDLMLRGVTNGTKAQKMGFASRWLGLSTIASQTLAAVGINAVDLAWYSPLQGFGGGPAYQLLTDMSGTLGGSYQQGQKRKQLLRDAANFIPGSYQLRALTRADEYASKGYPWLAFLALTSTPIRPDLSVNRVK